MKKMWGWHSFIFLFLALTITLHSNADTDNQISTGKEEECLELRISLNENVLAEQDPLSINLRLTNTCDQPLIINQRFLYIGPEIYLYIHDQSGYQLKWLPPSPPPPITRESFRTLEPHHFVSFQIQDAKLSLSDPLTPGNYTLYAIYRNDLGEEFDAWTGEIKSNVLEFTLMD